MRIIVENLSPFLVCGHVTTWVNWIHWNYIYLKSSSIYYRITCNACNVFIACLQNLVPFLKCPALPYRKFSGLLLHTRLGLRWIRCVGTIYCVNLILINFNTGKANKTCWHFSNLTSVALKKCYAISVWR